VQRSLCRAVSGAYRADCATQAVNSDKGPGKDVINATEIMDVYVTVMTVVHVTDDSLSTGAK